MKFRHHCSWNLTTSEWFPAAGVGGRMPYQTENISSSIGIFYFIRKFNEIQYSSEAWLPFHCFLFLDTSLGDACFKNVEHPPSIQKYFGTEKAARLSFALCVFLRFTPHESGQKMQPDCRGDILLVHRAADNKEGNIALCWANVDFFLVLYCWFSFTEWWLSLCFQKARIILELFGLCISSVLICMHR